MEGGGGENENKSENKFILFEYGVKMEEEEKLR